MYPLTLSNTPLTGRRKRLQRPRALDQGRRLLLAGRLHPGSLVWQLRRAWLGMERSPQEGFTKVATFCRVCRELPHLLLWLYQHLS